MIESNSGVVLRGVTVVDTRSGARLADQDVCLRGDVISESADAGATVVDARGLFVVPGYLDMHAHPIAPGADASDDLALMLAWGVTGFRQMSGTSALLAQRRAGTLRLPLDAPELLAMPGDLLTPMNTGTPRTAAATVREQHGQGADFIKVGLAGQEAFFAAQAEARRLGIAICGHLPGGIDVRAVSRGGMKSIEHLGPGVGVLAACSHAEARIRAEATTAPIKVPPFKLPFLEKIVMSKLRKIVVNPVAASEPAAVATLRHADETFDEDQARALGETFAADGTWQCPTLIRVRTQQFADAPEYRDDPNLRYVEPAELGRWQESTRTFRKQPAEARATFRRNYEIQLRLTKIFDEVGVPMLAGSDVCGAAWLVPGASLHQEFDELARAGLSPLRVLQMATLRGAEYLGRTATMGTVEAGKRADLVLLDADPIEDGRHLHAVAGVVRAGRYYARADLEALKDKVARGRSAG